MKNQIKKILLFGLLMINTMAFAFPADPNPTPDPPAPIDDFLLVLAFLGIGLVVWFNYKKTEKA